ncbi:MAG: hypothetical protein ACRDNS_10065, partial [Trebonia sp.]
ILAWQWADGEWPNPRWTTVNETEHYEFQLLARPEGRRIGPNTDPEVPGWSPREASRAERLAAQGLLYHRRLGQQAELAKLHTQRAELGQLEASDGEEQAQLDQIARQEREVESKIARYMTLLQEIAAAEEGGR